MNGLVITAEELKLIREVLIAGGVEHRFQLRRSIANGWAGQAGLAAKDIVRNERAQYIAWTLPWPCRDDEVAQKIREEEEVQEAANNSQFGAGA